MKTEKSTNYRVRQLTLGLDLVLDLGLFVVMVLFVLAGLALGLALAAEEDAVPTFDCTLGLDFGVVFVPARAALALVLALGLFSALALSTASKPIRLPVTYEGCALTRGSMCPGPFATESLPSRPFPFPDSSNLSL